jgi:HAE1 family hydrophobic/amphiphilic exporter-1
MLAASFIAIFLIPVTFYVMERLVHKEKPGGHGVIKRIEKEGAGHE